MNKHKIAILVDSCMDIPKETCEKYGMYVVPVKVIYEHGEYIDGIDITSNEVYENIEKEIPSTSLPDGQMVLDTLDRIKADGYEKVMVITISSGLSGTFNMLQLVCSTYPGLEFDFVDTKNIAIASGMSGIQAAKYIEAGMDWQTLKRKTRECLDNTKVFFCLATLKYLRHGGRIGRISALIGKALDLKPIISCNDEGVYYSAAKVRGRKKSIQKTIEMAVNFVKDGTGAAKYNIAVYHGYAKDEIGAVKEKVLHLLPNYVDLYEGQINPALGVHTGPGLIGVAVQKI